MTKRQQLIREIEQFCAAKGLSEREFAEVALGNPKFMGRLRRNVVTSRSMETAEQFLTDHRESDPGLLEQLVAARRARTQAATGGRAQSARPAA